MAIFATVSNLAHILCWSEENMNLKYGKHYLYEEGLYYGVADSLDRSETSQLPAGLLVGRSFGASEQTFAPGMTYFTNPLHGSSIALPDVSQPSPTCGIKTHNRTGKAGTSCSGGSQAGRFCTIPLEQVLAEAQPPPPPQYRVIFIPGDVPLGTLNLGTNYECQYFPSANIINLAWFRRDKGWGALTVKIPSVVFHTSLHNVSELEGYISHGLKQFLRQ